MAQAMATPPPPREDAETLRRLLHRWFVEYNPLALASAMLVLVGLNLLSKGLAERASVSGALGVALVAEVYALALIGSAALAYRIGQKRSAVLLGLLAVVYEADVTLHSETSSVLGSVGLASGAVWLALSGLKALGLSKALRLRVDTRVWALVGTFAVGLATLPFALSRVSSSTSGALVGGFVLVLGALVPRDLEGRVRSVVPLDARDETVLRRSVLAAFAILALGLVLHVGFWTAMFHVDALRVVLAVVALFVARRESERTVWVLVGCALLGTLAFAPERLSDLALASTAALLLRALSRTRIVEISDVTHADEAGPYRAGETTGPHRVEIFERYVPVDAQTRARLFTGALATAHLGLWTLAYHGGALPAHDLALDATVVGFALAMAWKLRARAALGLASAIVGHALFVSGLVPRPRTAMGWGATAIGLGFSLLAGSVGVGYHLAKDEPTRT